MAEVRSMEARLFGGVDFISMPTVLVGRTVEVLIRDMAGRTAPVKCHIEEAGFWQGNLVEIKGTLIFQDGIEKKFSGTLDISVFATIEFAS